MAVKKKKVLDIYIDEGGDFGISKNCSLLYLVSLVMFDNSNNIEKELRYLEEKLNKIGFNGMIHTAPLVGNRGEYVNYSIKKRKSILLALVYFASSIDVKMNSIIIEKSYISNQKQFLDRLENLLKEFLNENSKYLSLFDEIIVYYDKGQDILMKIIRNSFKDYKNVKIKTKFNHEDRLFQIADLLTFIDKIDYKINNKLKLIKSEKLFFNEFNAKEILKRINKNR